MELVKWLFTSCMRVHIESFISPFSRRKRKFLGGGTDSSEEANFWRPGKKTKLGLEKQTENLTLYTNPVLDTLDSRGHKSCSRENQHENKITDGITSVSADH